MRFTVSRSLVLIFALVILTGLDAHGQCAMCKEAAESSLKDDPNSMARSLNKGILYLMAVPYLMIAFIFRRQLYQLWKKATAKFSASRAKQL